MSSNVILALRTHLAWRQYNIDDDLVTSTANAQVAATPIRNAVSRVTVATASGSLILPDILTNVAEDMIWVLNDTAQTINVFPFSAGSINGAANTALSLTTGQAAVFIRDRANNDWRSAAIS